MAKHAPRFLQIVNEAKKTVKEVTVDDVKAMLDKGEKFAPDRRARGERVRQGPSARRVHLGKGVIERDIEEQFPTRDASWSSTAAAASARPWPPTTCRRWATPTSSRWTAASATGGPGNIPSPPVESADERAHHQCLPRGTRPHPSDCAITVGLLRTRPHGLGQPAEAR